MTAEEFNTIPIDLRIKDNWVNTKNASKCPWMASEDRPASSVNNDTWSSFKAAREAVEAGKYDGVGYCFDGSGIIGIDIDDGFDADGFISEPAAILIDKLHSYTEVSRSGRGFHIFVRGQLPFSGRNNGHGQEIYKSGRYFIVTGKCWFYDTIIENQAAIDWTVERFFPEMIHRASLYNSARKAMYAPRFEKREDQRISIAPEYPEIKQGCRNVSMLSLGGTLIRSGMTDEFFEREMRWVNQMKCKPPLSEGELRTVMRQCRKYR